MIRSRTAARLLLGGAGLLLVTGIAGCSSTGGAGTTLAPGAGATSAPTVPDGDAAASTTIAGGLTPGTAGAPATRNPVDGPATLNAALSALTSGYHFTTTVTVGGNVALTADGDRIGDGTRLTVEGSGGSVNYVILPAATWVQGADGTWEQLDSEPANTDPISALGAPSGVTVTGQDAGQVRMTVMVPGTSLGLPDGAPVPVLVVIDNGALTGVRYEATVDNRPAVVEATIGPPLDTSPVVAPA